MILDEATANIDTETELLIQDSLEKMKNIGTMLIVAHWNGGYSVKGSCLW